MYDNTCKFLAETFPTDFASWLLGTPITLTTLAQSELFAETIHADSVILLTSSQVVLHIEFQTTPRKNIPFRMADYRLRLYRKFPEKQVYQVVIYLTPSKSSLVFTTEFNLGDLVHKFRVIRLWEESTEILQQYSGLLPFTVLSKTSNPEETLKQVVKKIDSIKDRQVQSNIAAATAIISGLALDKQIIQRLLRSEIMKESPIYQEILLEGKVEGKAEGRAEGKAEGILEGEVRAANQIALNMLRSGIDVDVITKLTGLSVEQIQRLQ